VTALNQKLFFSDVLYLEVPLYHHPTAPQECEAKMLVCSMGLMPASSDDNHLRTIPECLTVDLVDDDDDNDNDNNNNNTAVGLGQVH